MQTPATVLRIVAFLCCFFLASSSFSQSKLIEMKDSTGLHSFSLLNGDTVLIRFDSAYVMNKATFKIYQETYRRVKRGDPAVKKLLADYEDLIALQDSMLRTKETYYQLLKGSFDSLAHGSRVFLDKTDANIAAIDTSLAKATDQLIRIQGLLDSALEKLRQEGRQRLKIAAKGFAVGLGTAAIIFLVTK